MDPHRSHTTADMDGISSSFAELMKRPPSNGAEDDALLATPRRRASPKFDDGSDDGHGVVVRDTSTWQGGVASSAGSRSGGTGAGTVRGTSGAEVPWMPSAGYAGSRGGGSGGGARASVPRSRSTSSSHSSNADAALSSGASTETDDGTFTTSSTATSPASEKGPHPSTAATSVAFIASELHAEAGWSQQAVSPRSPVGPFHLTRPPPPRTSSRTSSIPGTPPHPPLTPNSADSTKPQLNSQRVHESPRSFGRAAAPTTFSFGQQQQRASASADSPLSPASPQPTSSRGLFSLFRNDPTPPTPQPQPQPQLAASPGTAAPSNSLADPGSVIPRQHPDPSNSAADPSQLPPSTLGSASHQHPQPGTSTRDGGGAAGGDGAMTPRQHQHHQRPSIHHRKTHSLSFMRNFLSGTPNVDRSNPLSPVPASPVGGGTSVRASWGIPAHHHSAGATRHSTQAGALSRSGSVKSEKPPLAAPTSTAEAVLTKDDLQELEDFGVRVVTAAEEHHHGARSSFDRRSISSNGTSVPSPASPTASPTFSNKMLLESRRVSNSSLLSNSSQPHSHAPSPRAPTLSRGNSSNSGSGVGAGGGGGGGSIKRRRVSHGRTLSHLVSPTASKNIAAHMVITAVVENGLSAGLAETQLDGSGGARSARGIDGKGLGEKLRGEGGARRLLVVDTRRLSHFVGPSGRIRGSINVNFPSLLVKRFRKGSTDNFQLGSFITTEIGKKRFASLVAASPHPEDPLREVDICIVDEHLTERDVSGAPGSWGTATGSGTGVVLLSVLNRIAVDRGWQGELYYLDGSFADFVADPESAQHVVQGELADENRPAAQHPRLHIEPTQPEVEEPEEMAIASADSRHPVKPGLLRLQPSGPSRTLPRIETTSTPASPLAEHQASISAPPEGRPRLLIPGAPAGGGGRGKLQLKKLNTSDFALGTSGRPIPRKAPTPLADVHSLSPMNLDTSGGGLSVQELARSQARSPTVPGFDKSVHAGTKGAGFLAAVDEAPLSPAPTTHPEIHFSASTIIPGFLFLGGEPRRDSDFAELEELGVKRVINVALECVEEEVMVKQRGWKYDKIPLRDFVEEVGIQEAFGKVNALLDDANASNAPTYLHCVAGKSRSVSCTIAYLIHRYGWNLKTAYEHVGDRRKGISPNIGFISELLRFAEKSEAARGGGESREAGTRDSLPPGVGARGAQPALAFLGEMRADVASVG